jgi:hypothetical protein
MKTLNLSSLKINSTISISYEQACEVLKNTEKERDFSLLNESTISDSVVFECVQNRSYSLTKIGKKGTIIYKGSEYENKADVGVFEIEMAYDYRHPSNFCLNRNNCSAKFVVTL